MAGAGKGNGKGPAVATGAIIGGFCLLGLVLTGVAATIVLSLISIYTSDSSSEANGELYQISAFGLKSLFPNNGATYGGGAVAESSSLSSLCSSMYSSSSSVSNFAGCVATNFKATSANNSNTSRRRRQSESAAFLIGQINLYYSTSCGNSRDTNRGSNSSSLGACVRNRLSQCNGLFSSSGFRQWTPIPTGTILSIVAFTGWTTVPLSRLFAATAAQTADVAGTSFSNATAKSEALLGCVFRGTLSQAAIAAALVAQSSATTTAATTTIASG